MHKGIVSRDWAELEMILLDRLEVFNISASHFFYFGLRFCTVILKMAAWAVLQFNITHQMTTTALGTKTVLRNRKTPEIHSCTSLLSARRSYCRSFSALAGQYMFFEPVIARDWQSCRTVLDLWASNCRGLIVLRTVIFRGVSYSQGTFLLPQQSGGLVIAGDYQILPVSTYSLS